MRECPVGKVSDRHETTLLNDRVVEMKDR